MEKNLRNSGPRKEVITSSVLLQKSELQRKMLRLSIKKSAKELSVQKPPTRLQAFTTLISTKLRANLGPF